MSYVKLEPWSLPWHALQRRLADNAVANGKIIAAPSPTPTKIPTHATTANWLVRARVASGHSSAGGI